MNEPELDVDNDAPTVDGLLGFLLAALTGIVCLVVALSFFEYIYSMLGNVFLTLMIDLSLWALMWYMVLYMVLNRLQIKSGTGEI